MAGKKIIYHCYGGAHSSITAAAVHLGRLDANHIPSKSDLLGLVLFDRQTKEGHGRLYYLGNDEKSNQIYAVGCRNVGGTLEKVLRQVSVAMGLEDDLVFVDTLHCVNARMRIGGYISRRLGLISAGRPLVLQGTIKAYPHLVRLVERVKSEAAQ